MASRKVNNVPRSLMWPDHQFLNQAHAWFLKIDAVQIVGMRVRVCVCVYVHVCVSMPEAITNWWHDKA